MTTLRSTILAWFVAMGRYMISFFGTFFTIPLAGANGSEMTPAVPVFMLSFMLPFIIFGAIFIGGALFVIYGLIGAILVFQENDFHYIYK